MLYISKKTGVAYACIEDRCDVNLDGNIKRIYVLENIDNAADTKKVTESVLKRWYKKCVEVDFSVAYNMKGKSVEEKPDPEEPKKAEPEKAEKKVSKKTGKKAKKAPKTYEEQTWGLMHTRLSLDSFCDLYGIGDLEYDTVGKRVLFMHDGKQVSRRAWKNEVTGSVWFRFQNAEHELINVDYENGAFVEEEE